MSKKNNGGPAFPHDEYSNPSECGMTLRDYFAGQALTGMLADSDRSIKLYDSAGDDDEAMAEINAQWAYFMADAMLKERDK
jgi:hypothetical protein